MQPELPSNQLGSASQLAQLGHQIGLIDLNGQIDFTPGLNQMHLALNQTQTTPKMTLPQAVDQINLPKNESHELIGQVLDPTQQQAVGLIMKQGNRQYIILLYPVPTSYQVSQSRPPS